MQHNLAVALLSVLLLALSLPVAVEAYVAAPTTFSRQRQVSKYVTLASHQLMYFEEFCK